MQHHRTIQHVFFFILLALTTLAFFGLIRDFLQPLFWAAVLATLFHGLQVRYERWVGGRPSLAAVLTLLTIVLIVIVPLLSVGAAAARESALLYQRIASGEIDVQEILAQLEQYLPVVNAYVERFGTSLEELRGKVSEFSVAASRYVASQVLDVGQGALRFTVLLFLMLYILFFFLRDGRSLVDTLIRFLPLGNHREERLLSKFAEVSRATIKGTLIVGLVQGTLGGLVFWMLGIPAPVFWGVIMTILSLLPAVGSALVWLPAAIILMATGEVLKGLVLIAAGTLLIGLVDNILRPILVGRDTKMPDFLILLATLGGLALYGISGFVIGPIIAAFFLVVWEMFQETYGEEIERQEAGKDTLADAPTDTPADTPADAPAGGEPDA
ncbi:hypothetical protein AWN76_014120 [Rhodothermaceae bacterium RA]|nr:hypothetical protein AWN76_014120 [Rhodothermaceae bacterium RA]